MNILLLKWNPTTKWKATFVTNPEVHTFSIILLFGFGDGWNMNWTPLPYLMNKTIIFFCWYLYNKLWLHSQTCFKLVLQKQSSKRNKSLLKIYIVVLSVSCLSIHQFFFYYKGHKFFIKIYFAELFFFYANLLWRFFQFSLMHGKKVDTNTKADHIPWEYAYI